MEEKAQQGRGKRRRKCIEIHADEGYQDGENVRQEERAKYGWFEAACGRFSGFCEIKGLQPGSRRLVLPV